MCEFDKVLSLNIIGFNYELNPSLYESSKVSYPIILSLAMCWIQIHVGQAWCQAQLPWTELCIEPKCMWVSQDVRPNYLEFSYALSLNAYESDKVLDPSALGLESFQTQYILSW